MLAHLALQIFMWLYILLNISASNEIIYLHYNVIFGIDLVGQWWRILFLPLAAFLMMIVNTIFSLITFNNDKLISRLILFYSLVVQIFLALAVYFTVEINL